MTLPPLLALRSPFATFRGAQQFGRCRSEADIERFSVCTEPVAFDPVQTLAIGPENGVAFARGQAQ